jgi:hypothetical protein
MNRINYCCDTVIIKCDPEHLIIDLYMPAYMCNICTTKYRICIICHEFMYVEEYSIYKRIIFHFVKKHRSDHQITWDMSDLILSIDKLRIGINYILNTFPWIIFLTNEDFNAIFSKNIIEALKNNIEHIKGNSCVVLNDVNCSVKETTLYPTLNTNICDDLVKTFCNVNYSCTLCKMNYEYGMPDIGVIWSHIHNCIMNYVKDRGPIFIPRKFRIY